MKVFKLLLLCFICFCKSYGQVSYNHGQVFVEIIKEKNNCSTKVEVTGISKEDSSWVRNLKKNIIKSIGDGNEIKKGKYAFLVKFITSKDGNLSDISCKNDPGFGLCEKVVGVVKKSKMWKPSDPVKVREIGSTNE